MTNVSTSLPDAKALAARFDTWRGFPTEYRADSRHLLGSEIQTQGIRTTRRASIDGWAWYRFLCQIHACRRNLDLWSTVIS